MDKQLLPPPEPPQAGDIIDLPGGGGGVGQVVKPGIWDVEYPAWVQVTRLTPEQETDLVTKGARRRHEKFWATAY